MKTASYNGARTVIKCPHFFPPLLDRNQNNNSVCFRGKWEQENLLLKFTDLENATWNFLNLFNIGCTECLSFNCTVVQLEEKYVFSVLDALTEPIIKWSAWVSTICSHIWCVTWSRASVIDYLTSKLGRLWGLFSIIWVLQFSFGDMYVFYKLFVKGKITALDHRRTANAIPPP